VEDEAFVQMFCAAEEEFRQFVIVQVRTRKTPQSVHELDSREVGADRVV
jgi:ABC-type uncharacterized transport system YnjBCD ATPase subunit